ncbi:MAG: hypothetical protein EA370_09360 [Wenzhouxiangella sp.]|nr:MAG: hypothetical protein EA370_09360 [Wenzhouxiangella sp.]
MQTIGARIAVLLLAAAFVLPGSAAAQVIRVIYTDPPGFGFGDTTPVQARPGNPATTRGAQRREVMDAAVAIWASRLDSAIPIRVEASFEDLGCGDETILGLGGSTGFAWNFLNAPRSNINFPVSLATALRGLYYTELSAEMEVSFNVRIDSGTCIDGLDGFWYGLDPQVPPALGTFSFLELVVHELGHGLGFQSWTDRQTRDFFGTPPRPDIWSEYVFGLAQGLPWSQMTSAQRRATSTSGSNLVWTGERANLRAAERLLPPGRVSAEPSVGGQRHFPAWIQGYPPFLPPEGLTRNLVLADGPNPGNPGDAWHRNLACAGLENRDQVAGNIVLVKRGECTFAQKWQNVFNAGGAAILLVDNQPPGANAIERDRGIAVDRNLPIPIWLVSRDTGTRLRNALPGLQLTLGYNTAAAARGTNQGFINMLASPDREDSNVSHFSNAMFPQSVMNPSLTNIGFSGDIDFVPDLFYDIGWRSDIGKLAQYSGNWFNPARSGEGCQLTMEDGNQIPVLTCYLYRDGEQFWLIGNGVHRGDRYEFNGMTITEGADYGPGFRPEDVVRRTWGDITMRLRDCNSAAFEFLPEPDQGLPAFSTRMVKIVEGNCNRRASQQINRRDSGNYFDPDRSGEGVQIAREANGSSWVLTWYTYQQGRQVWMIGSGERIGNRIEFGDVVLTRGGQWGRAFRASQIERIDFGTITVDFSGCNDIDIAFDSVLPEFPSEQRRMTRIIPRNC